MKAYRKFITSHPFVTLLSIGVVVIGSGAGHKL